jgi:hypothetical protein
LATVEKSFKFANIENNLLKLLAIILNNQNILKYIYYIDSDNPLAESDVTIDLIQNGNIILSPFDPTILTEETMKVFINPLEGNFNALALSNLTFLIDIVLPVRKWLIPGMGKIRVFRISDELSQEIDHQKIMGMSECEVQKFRIYKVNDSYAGMSLWIKVNSSSMKGLR